eukprot:TRINITY_DN5837_c0_g1_i1.p1 TRINITY_DN5837_c0_g1~~TRINITY_DN5837_c0_g1_i1.p1  ORF type:complete len:247 (+),score=58.49 TRINITY_DN5837_c0_g1_i1:67-807(+)
MTFSVNAKGCLTEWSVDAEKLTGFSRREVLGLPILELVTFPFRGLVDEMMAMTRNGAVGQSVRMPFFDKAGDSVEILLSASSCEKNDGHLHLSCAPAEEEVRADAHDEELVSPGVDVCIDEHGRVSDRNLEAEEVTLFRRDEVIGMRFLDFVTVSYLESVAQLIRQDESAESARSLEIPFYTKAGEEVAIVLNARIIGGGVGLRGRFVENGRPDEAPEWDSFPSKGKTNIWNCDTCDSLAGILSNL